MNKHLLSLGLGLAMLAGAQSADAANIQLLNIDVPGVGLNDTTAAKPVGGNPGTTVGEQRRIAYQFAMDLWGGVLKSNVDIKIYASFAALTCDSTSAVLGQAGANWIVYNSPGAIPNTIYPSALGDALAGEDLVPDEEDPGDIFSQFNGNLGAANCLTGSGWYYGLDGNTPDGKINFLNVVMHEIGHGLGMASFINKSTGAFYGGLPDIYARKAFDNLSNKPFADPTMNNATRAASMRTPGRTVWTGANVTAQAPLLLDNKRRALKVTAPAAAAGTYELGFAVFGPTLTGTNMPSRGMVVVNDGVASASTSDGCETPFVNAAAVAGKYAVIDRGTCGFAVKVKNAQLNGAVGVIIANNAEGVIDMSGDDPSITIPAVMVSLTDGNRIKANAPATGGVVADPNLLLGADNAGRVRLYSPTTVASGSTFSHFDTALQPNARMEPFDTPEIQSQFLIDLTPAAMADIGWTLSTSGTKLGTCDTKVPGVMGGGFIPGANILAQSGICKAVTKGNRPAYLKCMVERTAPLGDLRLVTVTQEQSIYKCSALMP